MKNSTVRKNLVLLISVMLLLSIYVAVQSAQKEFHTTDIPVNVWGYVFVDGNIPDPDLVTLIFPSNVSFIAELLGSGAYQINFDATGLVGETGIFEVDIYGNSWIAAETIYITGSGSYPINLTVTTFPPNEVYVDDNYNESTPGWGYDHFDTIQDGIDAVNECGTVYVYNGIYYENVVVDKTINLTGEDRNTTIIDGSGSGDVVNVTVDWVNISRFMIRHSGGNTVDVGIEIHSNYNNIGGNNILDNSMGIKLDSTNNNIISNNNISSNNWIGIYILHESMSNILSDNILSYNNDGIYLLYSYNNIISGNIIRLNNDYGISLSDSTGNIISDNLVSGNTFDPLNNHGIQLYKSSENNISFNDINSNSRNGIWFHSSHNNTIINNIISSNNNYGIYIENITGHPAPPSNNNTFYHNNFINNTENSYDECDNTWDYDYPSGGNYWSDYIGDDLYNGPNQDIPGPDGIGDTPYNISGGDNQDLYPLMNPFQMYYILNISAPPEVNEGELFNVIVKSMGGTAIPNATVEFNDELKLTDIDGRVYFTAPQVGADTPYDIIATKEGYTGDSETILVKDVPVWFNYAFIFGRLDNLTTAGEVITFEALNIRAITFFPFTFNRYTSGELIIISKNYFGLVGARFIFAFCGLTYPSSAISMNIFDRDDSANKIIWMVGYVEGNPLRINDVETTLLNESGESQPDAEITFLDNNADGLITPGDIFTVVAPSDGYYVFMLTHKLSGAILYKSALTHY